jgi:hypothetical protein
MTENQRNYQTHTLYTNADKDAPPEIRDNIGCVALDLCKVCGRAEVELYEPCRSTQLYS